MSNRYKNSQDVPLQTIIERLRELSGAVSGGRESQESEFTMRVPAEVDRDADLVLSEAARRLEQAAQRQGRGPVTGPFHQMHSEVRHTDDEAVERFAAAMKTKLSDARGKGRGGWDDPGQCAEEFLVMLFGQHLAKANQWNWVDLANFCMMLHERHVDPSYASSAVAVAADTLYGTGWEGRAQRQGGEAVAWMRSDGHVLTTEQIGRLKIKGGPDNQARERYSTPLYTAPQPAVPESDWTPCSDLICAGEELKWAIISSPALPSGWKDDRLTDAIEQWHDAARQRPEPPEDD